jgi:hypothetical protein
MEDNKEKLNSKPTQKKKEENTLLDSKDGLKWYWIVFFSFCALLFFYTISFFIFYFGYF